MKTISFRKLTQVTLLIFIIIIGTETLRQDFHHFDDKLEFRQFGKQRRINSTGSCSLEIERCMGNFGEEHCEYLNGQNGEQCCCANAPDCKRRPPGGTYAPRRCHKENYMCGRLRYACKYSFGHPRCKHVPSEQCCCKENPFCVAETAIHHYCRRTK